MKEKEVLNRELFISQLWFAEQNPIEIIEFGKIRKIYPFRIPKIIT